MDIVGFIFGTLFAVIGARVHWKTMAVYRNALCTRGQVVELVQEDGHSYPIVHFRSDTGAAVRFQSLVGSSPPLYKAGQWVRVVFRPEAPNAARIDDFWHRWFGILLAGVGVVMVVLILGMAWGLMPEALLSRM